MKKRNKNKKVEIFISPKVLDISNVEIGSEEYKSKLCIFKLACDAVWNVKRNN
jgi:hypothetical protein